MSTRDLPAVNGEWIVRTRKAGPLVRLVCVPYAGGAASAFRLWPHCLPNWAELCAVQLPGREQRHREALTTVMPAAVNAVAEALLPLSDVPLVLFGHSMGAIIAYETARLLQRLHGISIRHLIVSGRRAPHVPSMRPDMHSLPRAGLVDQLRRLNGTPGEVLNDAEMLDIMLPIIRADFELIETYRPSDAAPLGCPVTAVGGDADPDVSPTMLQDWRVTTSNAFDTRVFPGDHFYLNSQRLPLVDFIADRLGPR
jgi:medium-chain acyl-[acyl-carrier-protein] hydrolase